MLPFELVFAVYNPLWLDLKMFNKPSDWTLTDVYNPLWLDLKYRSRILSVSILRVYNPLWLDLKADVVLKIKSIYGVYNPLWLDLKLIRQHISVISPCLQSIVVRFKGGFSFFGCNFSSRLQSIVVRFKVWISGIHVVYGALFTIHCG